MGRKSTDGQRHLGFEAQETEPLGSIAKEDLAISTSVWRTRQTFRRTAKQKEAPRDNIAEQIRSLPIEAAKAQAIKLGITTQETIDRLLFNYGLKEPARANYDRDPIGVRGATERNPPRVRNEILERERSEWLAIAEIMDQDPSLTGPEARERYLKRFQLKKPG